MSTRTRSTLPKLKPYSPISVSKKIDSVKDGRNQRSTNLTKITSDLYLTIPKSDKKFNLNNPKNIDSKEKLLDGAEIPETYVAGVNNDMNKYGNPIDVISFISNNPLLRKYIINNFDIHRKDFEVYFLTQIEFNDLILKNEYLENALVNYLKTKKYDIIPLYAKYIKNPISMKRLREIRKKAEADANKKNPHDDNDEEEYENDDDEFAEYLDEDVNPTKKSSAQNKYNENPTEQEQLTQSRVIILWISVFIVFLILNISMVPFENYGSRIISIAFEMLILYGTYKGLRWILLAHQTVSE